MLSSLGTGTFHGIGLSKSCKSQNTILMAQALISFQRCFKFGLPATAVKQIKTLFERVLSLLALILHPGFPGHEDSGAIDDFLLFVKWSNIYFNSLSRFNTVIEICTPWSGIVLYTQFCFRGVPTVLFQPGQY